MVPTPRRCVVIFLLNHFDGSELDLPSSVDFLSANTELTQCAIVSKINTLSDQQQTQLLQLCQIFKSIQSCNGNFYLPQMTV